MGKRSKTAWGWALIAIAIGGVAFALLSRPGTSEAAGRRKSLKIWHNLPPQFTDAPSSVNGETGKWCSIVVKAEDPEGLIPIITAHPIPEGALFVNRGDGSAELGFIPTLSQVGKTMVYFVASDGQLADTTVVWLIITEGPGSRHAPVLQSLPPEVSIEVGNPTSFKVAATDSDGTIPALFVDSLPANSSFIDRGSGYGTFSITPTSVQTGRIALTFIASDGVLADSAVVVLVISEPVYFPPDTIQGVSYQADLIASFRQIGAIDQLRAEDMDGDGLAEILFRHRLFGSNAGLEIWKPASASQIPLPPAESGILSYSLRPTENGVQPVIRLDSGQILVLNATGTGWDSVATVPLRSSQFQWVPHNPNGWQICYEFATGSSSRYTDPPGTCTYSRYASWSDTKFIGEDGSTSGVTHLGIAGAIPNGLRSLRQIFRNGNLQTLLIPSASREDEYKSGNCMPTHLFDADFLLTGIQAGSNSIDTLRLLYGEWSPDFIGPYAQFESYMIGMGEWHRPADTNLVLAFVDNIWPYQPGNSYTRWKMVTITLGGEKKQTTADFTLQPYLSRGGIVRTDAASLEMMIVAADTGLAYVFSIPEANPMGRIRLPRAGEFLTAYAMDPDHRDLIFKSGESIEIYRVRPAVTSKPTPITIRVPGERPTIQAAINSANHGDTVMVAPGKYVENLDFLGKRIVVTGFADSSRPVLEPGDSNRALVRFGSAEPSGTILEGFDVRGGSVRTVVQVINGAEPTIEKNIFSHCRGSGTIVACDQPHVTVIRNLFADNPQKVAIGVISGTADIFGNTFDRNFVAISDNRNAASIRNNSITNSTASGLIRSAYQPVIGLSDYNNIWNNHPNYGWGARLGLHDISFDPLYEDTGKGSYAITAMSPCIDNGDPDSVFADLDGTIADIGAFSFVDSTLPRAVHLRVLPSPFWRITTAQPIFQWTFMDTGATHQTAYRIEVGTDTNWAVAECWSSGEISSRDSSAVYSGVPLARGSTYYFRLRVGDDGDWSNWAGAPFHMNALPTVPTPLFPVGGGRINQPETRLIAAPSSDADLDSIFYGFEVYSDSGLTELVAADSGRTQLRDSVQSQAVSGLVKDHTYWWRVRAFDRFEYSNWSAPESFRVMPPGRITVPDDQPTIQKGILAAGEGDTLLVKPGTYLENLNLQRGVVLLGTDGAEATLIAAPNHARATITGQFSRMTTVTIAGFRITSGSVGIYCGNVSINVFDNIISGNQAAMSLSGRKVTVGHNLVFDNVGGSEYHANIEVNGDSTFIHRNVMYGNSYKDEIGGTFQGKVHNNTIAVATHSGIHLYGGNVDVRNNVIFGAKEVALLEAWGVINSDYNCLFGNKRNYYAVNSGAHDLLRDARFIDSTHHDYRLLQISPCIDAGDPDPRFNDPDGSRSDIGAIPYVPVMSAAEQDFDDPDILSVVDLIAKRTSDPSDAPTASELAAMIRRLFGSDSTGIDRPASPPPD